MPYQCRKWCLFSIVNKEATCSQRTQPLGPRRIPWLTENTNWKVLPDLDNQTVVGNQQLQSGACFKCESQSLPQTCWSRISLLTRSPVDSCAYPRLRSTCLDTRNPESLTLLWPKQNICMSRKRHDSFLPIVDSQTQGKWGRNLLSSATTTIHTWGCVYVCVCTCMHMFHSCQGTIEPECNEYSLRCLKKVKMLKDAEENFTLTLKVSVCSWDSGQNFLFHSCYHDFSSFIHSFIHWASILYQAKCILGTRNTNVKQHRSSLNFLPLTSHPPDSYHIVHHTNCLKIHISLCHSSGPDPPMAPTFVILWPIS